MIGIEGGQAKQRKWIFGLSNIEIEVEIEESTKRNETKIELEAFYTTLLSSIKYGQLYCWKNFFFRREIIYIYICMFENSMSQKKELPCSGLDRPTDRTKDILFFCISRRQFGVFVVAALPSYSEMLEGGGMAFLREFFFPLLSDVRTTFHTFYGFDLFDKKKRTNGKKLPSFLLSLFFVFFGMIFGWLGWFVGWLTRVWYVYLANNQFKFSFFHLIPRILSVP